MKPVGNQTIVQQLNWRYATKKFDPSRRISPEDWATLESALALTPSSYGLQPWKFVVVTKPEIREGLLAASWGQRQVADASHLVVFAARKDLSLDDVDHHFARINEVTGAPVAALAGLRSMIGGSLDQMRPLGAIPGWNARQVYIALGFFMAAAALLGIDTCPMEGFAASAYDEALGLGARGYTAVVLCPAGYRSADDKYADRPKVRFPETEVIEHVA